MPGSRCGLRASIRGEAIRNCGSGTSLGPTRSAAKPASSSAPIFSEICTYPRSRLEAGSWHTPSKPTAIASAPEGRFSLTRRTGRPSTESVVSERRRCGLIGDPTAHEVSEEVRRGPRGGNLEGDSKNGRARSLCPGRTPRITGPAVVVVIVVASRCILHEQKEMLGRRTRSLAPPDHFRRMDLGSKPVELLRHPGAVCADRVSDALRRRRRSFLRGEVRVVEEPFGGRDLRLEAVVEIAPVGTILRRAFVRASPRCGKQGREVGRRNHEEVPVRLLAEAVVEAVAGEIAANRLLDDVQRVPVVVEDELARGPLADGVTDRIAGARAERHVLDVAPFGILCRVADRRGSQGSDTAAFGGRRRSRSPGLLPSSAG